MKTRTITWTIVFGMMFFGFLATDSLAIEILTEQDITENVVDTEDIIKLADNFIVMLDTSGSMMEPCEMDKTMTKLQVATKILNERGRLVPELGYMAGLYTFAPFKELYPMQAYDREKYGIALDQVPAKSSHPTLLQKGLSEMDPVLKGLSGKTVIFMFTDGTYSKTKGMKTPDMMVAELADKYDVCFYMISCAEGQGAQKLVQDMASANACSRVIPFGVFIVYPDYHTGALFVVKSGVEIVTTTETRIVGIAIDHTLFGFDKTESLESSNAELDELGAFMQKNPSTYAVMAGFTDSDGSAEYNLTLSRKRVEHAAAYLTKNFNIASDRLILHWYGEADPVASNDTEEGRQLNRRVQIAVGGM
ncbi:MAG: OmpA family protein [Deltaproteobacteria bacterium]|nr:OmpA family protein [Deltaproteobacteria bacterium]